MNGSAVSERTTLIPWGTRRRVASANGRSCSKMLRAFTVQLMHSPRAPALLALVGFWTWVGSAQTMGTPVRLRVCSVHAARVVIVVYGNVDVSAHALLGAFGHVAPASQVVEAR